MSDVEKRIEDSELNETNFFNLKATILCVSNVGSAIMLNSWKHHA
jgi:hypothetical protein